MGFPMVFLWFHHFPMAFLWFLHSFLPIPLTPVGPAATAPWHLRGSQRPPELAPRGRPRPCAAAPWGRRRPFEAWENMENPWLLGLGKLIGKWWYFTEKHKKTLGKRVISWWFHGDLSKKNMVSSPGKIAIWSRKIWWYWMAISPEKNDALTKKNVCSTRMSCWLIAKLVYPQSARWGPQFEIAKAPLWCRLSQTSELLSSQPLESWRLEMDWNHFK